MQYINFNGNIYPENEPVIAVTNRAFRYGDGFFESMVMFNKKIPLLDYHWSRMVFTCEVLGAALPRRFDVERFESMVLDLCAVNDIPKNGRIRLQLYRKGKGFYLPQEDELGYTISVDEISNAEFECGEGLIAGMREDGFKPFYNISDLKTSSALVYVLYSQFAQAENWDEIILTDSNGLICEGIKSNIFLFTNNKLVTPDLNSGCVNGVMRNYLISEWSDVVDEREVESKELLDAEEILLVNAVKGVQWVKAFSGKNYSNKMAIELTSVLNKNLVVSR